MFLRASLRLASALLLISYCTALSFWDANSRPHVCIIGGGIAGAVTAHYLANATNLTLFEAAPRVGGRIATLHLAPGLIVEAGASVLAAENALFAGLAEELSLLRKGPSAGEGSSLRMGLWDGETFRYQSTGRPWIDAFRMLWRFGLPLLRMRRYVSTLLVNFDRLYVGADKGYEGVEELLARAPGMFALTQQKFEKTAAAGFGGVALVDELVSAITRVNYNQDVSEMNGMSGAVAIAGSGGGLWAVRGGNQQVPEGLIARSNATVHLSTRISVIEEVTKTDSAFLYLLRDSNGTLRAECDAVVIAAPLELAEIKFAGLLPTASMDVNREYQRTVATFVHGSLSRERFGEDAPDIILTTARAPTPFSSLARIIASEKGGFFFKIFSKQSLERRTLDDLFEPGAEVVDEYNWFAYPKFSPPEVFSSFRVANSSAIFYTAPIESAASAIEMSALSGRNAAGLVRKALGQSSLPEGAPAREYVATGKDSVGASFSDDAGGKSEL